MPVFLKEVHIENFKSFFGRFTLGPFRRFTSITGPNGSGKSNLMDAIAFCLGENSSNLRARRLVDLVNKQVTLNCDRDAYVATIFKLENGNEKEFKRMIINNSSEYLIDRKVVAKNRYIDELKDLGVQINLKNCFVYQGFVDNIAQASPKELTDFFEKVSGSIEYKEKYNCLEKKLNDMKAEYVDLRTQKTKFKRSKKTLSIALELNRKMDYLKTQADEYEMELSLIGFMILDREKNAIYDKKDAVITEEVELNKKIQDEKLKIQHLKREKIHLQQMENSRDEQLAKIDAEHKKIFMEFSEKSATVKYYRDRLHQDTKILQSHEKDERQRQLTIQNLKQELENCMSAKNQYSQESTVESQIVEENKHEFDNLQRKVMKKTKNIQTRLDLIVSKYREVIEKLENKNRIKMDIERKIQGKFQQLEIYETRKINMLNLISEIEKKLEKSREECNKFLDDTLTYDAIKLKLEEATDHLNSLRLTKLMCNTVQKEQTIFNELRDNIPNLIGRMYDLCKPVHPRYQVAMTRIFGKNLSAIVVDNSTTARECIRYLRVNGIGHEIFLPLADLRGFSPLKVHLSPEYVSTGQKPGKNCLFSWESPVNRALSIIALISLTCTDKIAGTEKSILSNTSPVLPGFSMSADVSQGTQETGEKIGMPDVKLLYDVIQFPPEISQAVLYVVGNTLVCDKSEDAQYVAWNVSDSKTKYDCIALDGTYFKNTGMFSGGQVTLAEKSQKFDASAYGKAKHDYEVALNVFKAFKCPVMDEMDVSTKELEIRELETQLQRYQKWLSSINKDQLDAENEIKNLRTQLTEMEKDRNLEEKKEQILKKKLVLENEIHEIENKIYAKFCSKLNINSIRNFVSDLELFREKQTKLADIDKHCDVIRAQLDYENSRDKTAVIEKLRKSILNNRKHLDGMDFDVEEEKKRLIAAHEEELGPLKKSLEDLRNNIAKLTKDEGDVEANLKKLLKARRNAHEKQKIISQQLMEIFHQHQNLSRQAKMTFGINKLPLLSDCSSMSSDSKYTPMTDMGFHKSEWMEIDFSVLPDKVREADNNEILVIRKTYEEKIKALHEEITKMTVVNCDEFLSMNIDAALKNVNKKLKNHLKDSKNLQMEFDQVKKLRYNCFVDCFQQTQESINQIYQQITGSTAAHSNLFADNPEEPFLTGIRYNCMPANKRSTNLDDLSGGELTLACLALLFAVKSTPTPPFLFLDEAAVSLDNSAVKNLISFIKSSQNSRQIFFISHNPRIFGNTDDIIVTYGADNNGSLSQCMTNLVMTSFQERYLPVDN